MASRIMLSQIIILFISVWALAFAQSSSESSSSMEVSPTASSNNAGVYVTPAVTPDGAGDSYTAAEQGRTQGVMPSSTADGATSTASTAQATPSPSGRSATSVTTITALSVTPSRSTSPNMTMSAQWLQWGFENCDKICCPVQLSAKYEARRNCTSESVPCPPDEHGNKTVRTIDCPKSCPGKRCFGGADTRRCMETVLLLTSLFALLLNFI